MMHLYAAHLLNPAGSDSYFLGAILPDCVDAYRDIKDKLGDLKRHFDNAGCCGKEGCDCKVEEKIVVEE